MSPDALAALHAAAFAPARGWSAEEIADLCQSPHVTCYSSSDGFALVRSLADEAELLTLAVHPAARRLGKARQLMQAWLSTEAASVAFLEVAEDNTPAYALYAQLGFVVIGRRRCYYVRPTGAKVDALLMQLALRSVNSKETNATSPKTG